MTHEELFVETIKDLKSKLDNGGEYQLLRACGLMRHILLDYPPLLNLANTKFKIKITFTIDAEGFLDIGSPIIQTAQLDYIFEDTKILNLHEFINEPIVRIWEHDYKVSEIIRCAAHKQGGVHSQGASNRKEEILVNLPEITKRPNWGVFLTAITSIGNVIIHATEPLVNSINGHTPVGGL